MQIDPAQFAPEAITPETAEFVAWLEDTLLSAPKPHEIPVEASRQARDEGRGLFPSGGPLPEGSDWVTMPSGRRVRVSKPAGPSRGIYLHVHGGGWALGRPSHYDTACQAIARDCGVTVVSVEYRLAPEHPFPAGPDDCLAAAEWVLGENPYGDGPVVIGGESAGAHLALVTALSLRDAGRADRVRGLVLNYGCFDLRLTASARNWGDRQLILSTPTMDFFSDNFVPDKAARAHWRASPIMADLRGLPPALLQIGTEDPLLDDSLLMAVRMTAVGVPAELAVFPGGVHAFDNFTDLAITKDYYARRAAFVSARIG